MTNSQYLTYAEAATLIGVSTPTIYNLIREGWLQPVRFSVAYPGVPRGPGNDRPLIAYADAVQFRDTGLRQRKIKLAEARLAKMKESVK